MLALGFAALVLAVACAIFAPGCTAPVTIVPTQPVIIIDEQPPVFMYRFPGEAPDRVEPARKGEC